MLASCISYAIGLFHNVWENDNSYLSFVILALFYGMTAWCGVITWKIDNCYSKFYSSFCKIKGSMELKEEVIRAEQVGWFSSDQCLTIGMIGTVWGFIMMLRGFGGFTGDANAVQKLMDFIVAGMGTALYTTFVGLICGMLLKIQYFNISHAIEKLPTQTVADLFGEFKVPVKSKCGGKECCKKEKQKLNPYYTSQTVINETTQTNIGDGIISTHGLIRFPVVPGTLGGIIYRVDLRDGLPPIAVQKFNISSSGVFDNQLMSDDAKIFVQGAKLDAEVGVVELIWNEIPGPNFLTVNYEYEMED